MVAIVAPLLRAFGCGLGGGVWSNLQKAGGASASCRCTAAVLYRQRQLVANRGRGAAASLPSGRRVRRLPRMGLLHSNEPDHCWAMPTWLSALAYPITGLSVRVLIARERSPVRCGSAPVLPTTTHEPLEFAGGGGGVG